MNFMDRMTEILNEERRRHGEPQLNSAEIEGAKDYYASKLEEVKNTEWYKSASAEDKRHLNDLVISKTEKRQMMPTCSINSNNGGTKVMNEEEQINSFRGLGYDNIIEDGLSKDLSAGDIAINILNEIPANRYVDQQRAINLLVEAANNITNQDDKKSSQGKSSNVSEKQQAVDLLVNAAKTIQGGRR
ncbi:hypothetical protein [Cellulosilyticum sp. WCF-2]|uniref:hypothetical protein n=1 Tax=Cellulosilyticum sp. WCF-2 TaxID=2497860 RepID=UPI000F8C88CF|nr:hypothetical protein [Cellulosilyticum sp. WCF-2]QEH68694.1 hypothetical protein EKH84_10015 [Cellulosilyticum sp. WCF-2]